MTARLVAEEGILKGLVLPLEEGDQWVVGRDPDSCQLLLEDPAASRKHLLLRKSPGGIVLENLSKTNPVEVNNEELVNPRILQNGDIVKIGSGIFRFDLPTTNNVEIKDSSEDLILNGHSRDSIFEDNPEQISKQQNNVAVNFDLMEVGRWLLKVIGGPNNGAEFSMQENTVYIIGTDPNTCDIVFHDTSVSRQHARISVSPDEEIVIEDLKSRNGTLVDGQKIEGKERLSTNTIVTMGTTSFVIYDREGNMQTIISPLLPSIVKVLQKDEPKEESLEEKETIKEATPVTPEPIKEPIVPPKEKNFGKFIFTAGLTGLLAIAGIGVLTLFTSKPIVVEQQANPDKILSDLFQSMPNIKYSFTKSTGRLFLIGHVLTAQEKNQLLYNLQGLNFIKSIDDTGIIIDEYVWQEANLLLNKNPNWRGITIQSPTAGQFVLSGYLQTRNEAEQLYEYIASNFPYLDRLEKRVIVDEDVLASARNDLEQVGIRNVTVQFHNGEILLSGGVAEGKKQELAHVVEELKKIPGIRNVRVQVNQIAPDQAMINITDKYEVTGFSVLGSKLSVIINGRIVSKGDVLDGMLIKEVTPGTIFLEKNGIKYRIDFSS